MGEGPGEGGDKQGPNGLKKGRIRSASGSTALEAWNLIKMKGKRHHFQMVGLRQVGDEDVRHGDGDTPGTKTTGQGGSAPQSSGLISR